MLTDDEKARARFELVNANLQSISRAQGLYLTTLLIYICIVWAKFLTGNGAPGGLHFEWLDLNMDAVWAITPFVTMVLTLAVTGTLSSMTNAYSNLQHAGRALFGEHFDSLFEVDTHKNVVDYLERLQLIPWGKTRKPSDVPDVQPLLLRTHHLIFPVLFALSLATSGWAAHRSAFSPRPPFFRSLGWVCFAIQALFSVRPVYRWIRRFAGAKKTDDVYN